MPWRLTIELWMSACRLTHVSLEKPGGMESHHRALKAHPGFSAMGPHSRAEKAHSRALEVQSETVKASTP